MTREESHDIVAMVINYWRGRELSVDEMDAYARTIQHLDAEVCTSALIRAARSLTYRPQAAEVCELTRAEQRRLRPVVEPIEFKPTPLPLWVKRWMCARLLYDRWGKARDDRRFPEQGDYGDLTMEMMPEGAWVEEAESMDDDGMMNAFRGISRATR